MNELQQRHEALTKIRLAAYEELFCCKPSHVFSPAAMFKSPDATILIDVYVFTLEFGDGEIDVAVTNGMSDERLKNTEDPESPLRREILQYFPKCTADHARRLYDMAWLPRFDEFTLDSHHTIAWNSAAIEGTPWTSAFFLRPIIRSHTEFECLIEGDEMSFLWHIPISEAERAYKVEHGADALIDRLEAVELPWIFDESNRPSLLED